MLLKNQEAKLERPTKYSRSVAREICRLVEALGITGQDAARLEGVSASTFEQWKQDLPEFSDSIQQAEAKFELRCLTVIRRAILNGDWRAAEWLLERRWPEEFGNKGRHLIPTQREDKPPRPEDYIEAINQVLQRGQQPGKR